MKRAACGRMDRRRQVAGQNDARALRSRFKLWHSRDQSLRIRMLGLADDGFGVCHFDDFAQIHDHNPVAEVFDYGQVMGDKEKSYTVLLLQTLQEVDDLGLNRNVQGANWLVTNE